MVNSEVRIVGMIHPKKDSRACASCGENPDRGVGLVLVLRITHAPPGTFEFRPRGKEQRPSRPPVRKQEERNESYRAREEKLSREPRSFELVFSENRHEPRALD
jgi:hypothetical protein